MNDQTPSSFDNKTIHRKKPVKLDLKIAPGKKKKLTKNQQTFNRLTKRIEQLQNAIRKDTTKLETVLKTYNANIPALQQAISQSRLTLAKTLGKTTEKIKYGKRQADNLRNVILLLCDEAFAHLEPDQETELFYNAWSESNYREEMQSQQNAMKRAFAEYAKDAFGMDIDLDSLGDTPEEFVRFARRMLDDFKNSDKQREEPFSRKYKSKKQLAREELRQKEEAHQLKSMRSLYLSLAKALHPDIEMDLSEKRRKEELMKKVTAAYADKDLTTLLKLEMQWVASETRTLDSLPDEKLKLYIASLKEQAAALEEEHASVFYHPRFAPINDVWHLSEQQAIHEIQALRQDCIRLHEYISDMTDVCSDSGRRKEIVEFVKEYIAMAGSELSDPFHDYPIGKT
jgi:hypothetical protein